MKIPDMKAPFPWWGGKRRVADQVWSAFGDVDNYVEPFAGSLAVLLGRPSWHLRRAETVNDMDQFLCLDPSTRVLGADLKWRPIGDVVPGEQLLAFDESNGAAVGPGLRSPSRYRRMAVATATASKRLVRPCYRLTFSDGTTVVASEDHQWLCGSHRTGSGGRAWRWVATKNMASGRATQRSWVLKVCDVVEQEQSYDAGWLGGFLDGEGNLKSASTGRPGWSVNASQKVGAESDRFAKLMADRGFDVKHRSPAKVSERHQQMDLHEIGTKRQVLRLLMMTRPERLIANLMADVGQRSLYGRSHDAVSLESKEYLGEREVIALETDTHTFIAEGLASHNCNFWRALAHDPIAVAQWCDWPVNEADLFARHLWLVNEGRSRLASMDSDPDFYDVKVAGWWVWGINAWIGSGWCSGNGPHTYDSIEARQLPHLGDAGRGVNRQLPHLGNAGRGVNRQLPHLGNAGRGVNRQLPHLGDAGRGVNRQLPHLGNAGRGVNRKLPSGVWGTGEKATPDEESTASFRTLAPPSFQDISEKQIASVRTLATPDKESYFCALCDRLSKVRVVCGDWARVCTMGALNYGADVGVFLDPPYLGDVRTSDLYACDDHSIANEVREWALANGDDPRLRIILAGYEPEHIEHMPDTWRMVTYSASKSYGSKAGGGVNDANRHLERLWFSPHCLGVAEPTLFDVVP